MLNPFDLALGLRRVIYFTSITVGTMGGLVTVWLARPKNATAELVAGTISGGLAAVVSYTISWGWIAASLAGLPYGIWLGMLSALVFMGSVLTVGTMAAGMLLRRFGQIRSMIVPYIELVIPAMLALIYANGMAFNFAIGRYDGWAYYLVAAVLAAIAAVGAWMRFNWVIRVVLHAVWLASVCAFAMRPLP
jgi:hypothetical protein